MSFTDFIQLPISKKITLVEIDYGKRFTDILWVKDQETTWKWKYWWDENDVRTFSYGRGAYGYGPYGGSGTFNLPPCPREPILKLSSIYATDDFIIKYDTLEDCRNGVLDGFYFDSVYQVIYMNNHDIIYNPSYTYNPIIFGVTIGYSDKAGYFDNIYYDGRLLDVDDIKYERDSLFYGKISFEKGSLSLNNSDGFFDTFYNQDIYGSELRIRMGGNGYYQTLYTGFLEKYEVSVNDINITFLDSRRSLSERVPPNSYLKEDYPDMNDSNSGLEIPLGYGRIKRGSAVCLNEDEELATEYTFKFVDTTNHPIESINAVYIDNTEVTPTSTDLTNGTFVLDPADYNAGDTVYVDFNGYTEGGSLITNPLDIIKDLIVNHAENIIYSDLFFDTTNWDALTAIATQEIAILITNKTEIYNVIEKIASSIFGLFIITGEGLYDFKFIDTTATPVGTIYLDEILDQVRIETPSEEYLNSARISYDHYWATEHKKYYTNTTKKQELYDKYRTNIEEDFETVLKEESDVITYSNTILDSFGGIFPQYQLKTGIQHITYDVGDNVYLEVDKEGGRIKCNILSKAIDLNAYTTSFILRFVENIDAENIYKIIRETQLGD